MPRGLALCLVAALWGCGAAAPTVTLPSAPPQRDAAALSQAQEAFYTAADVAGLRAAVDRAREAGPDAAGYHEIAAQLALLEDRPRDAIDHLLSALLDPAADAPTLYMHRLADQHWTLAERQRIEATLAAIRAAHPDPEVRTYAAWMAAHAAHLRADTAGRDAALAEVGFRLPFAVIGPFDNDQGKALDAEQPPERGIDLKAKYPGQRVELSWRVNPPLDPRGKLDLASLLEPSQWQLAYAASAVDVAREGDYELRVSSTDPFKVFVDDVLVFEARSVDQWLFDGFAVPVHLRAGVNRVLIKSAQEKGGWVLVARLTGPGGAALPSDAVKSVAADTPPVSGATPGPTVPVADVLAARVARLAQGARREALTQVWADDMGLRTLSVEHAEAFVRTHPKSLMGRYRLALALWNNQERGRTADLLNTLTAEADGALPTLELKQAYFWQQQKLVQKARELLVRVHQQWPERPGAARALASLLEKEGWHEERCALLEDVARRQPQWPTVQLQL
ncbi:MAG: hypothetical protein KC620_23150, partial [Myxococcales bacterium]|nr:hypothetical protein [Myxococcales bacterium]